MRRQHLALVLAACFATLGGTCRSEFIGPQLFGSWGGEHITMEIAAGGATIEYDCANGTIDGFFVIDGSGRFDLTGVHVREQGGPVQDGVPPDAHPARYVGRTDGRTMSLTVTMTDTDQVVGTFALVRGVPGQVFKCL